jgi:hypothetical protein
MLVDEGLDQIVNPIDHRAAPWCFFSSAGSRPSSLAAKIFCACARAIGKVTRQ